MNMPFSIAGGTSAGGAHVRARRGPQDAFALARHMRGLVAVVCDGCGSTERSELGAAIGARVFAAAAHAEIAGGADDPLVVAEAATNAVLARLGDLARATSADGDPQTPGALGGYDATVHDAFLFTVVAAIVLPEATAIVALGDGVVQIDGALVPLGPFEDDAPPYLGRALVDPWAPRSLALVDRRATADVRSLVLGSDGAASFVARGEVDASRHPSLLTNPDGLRRRLAVLQRGAGALSDDATVVLVARRGAA